MRLTESILQACYKTKTYVRNGEWDILWYLGGRNNVTIGEKDGRYYLLPIVMVETVTEVLPFELVQGSMTPISKNPRLIENISELMAVYPELDKYIVKKSL